MSDTKTRYVFSDGDLNLICDEDEKEYEFDSFEDAKERRDEIEDWQGGPIYVVKETREFIREKDYWGWE
jgi:hypothetical protein